MKRIFILIVLLSLPVTSHAVVAYLPHELRECICTVHEMAEKKDTTDNLAELCSMIMENRVITSDSMVHKAIHEALNLLDSDTVHAQANKDSDAIKHYLKTYLNSLHDMSLLLTMQADAARCTSLPLSLMERSLDVCSNDMDMMRLSSELACSQSIQLCGNFVASDLDLEITRKDNKLSKSDKHHHHHCHKHGHQHHSHHKSNDPNIVFNANMMTNVLTSSPNIIFGTGVSSLVINAWSMLQSNLVQSPINMQFAIPDDLDKSKSVTLELHFLVTQQLSSNGNARIRVDAEYMSNQSEFNVDSPTFTSTSDSSDFLITEPSSSTNVAHVTVTIPLSKVGLKVGDFALLSLTRIAPHRGVEYAQAIYLAAAVFNYTAQ